MFFQNIRRLIVGLFVILYCSGSCPAFQIQSPKIMVAKIYDSPAAVFEAYRKAYADGDGRTLLLCHTPEMRDDVIFELWFGCRMQQQDPKFDAILKKYVPGDRQIFDEYCKRYKEKYDVDLAKLQAEYREKEKKVIEDYKRSIGSAKPFNQSELGAHLAKIGPRPPEDEELRRKALISSIIDKNGFAGAATKVLQSRDVEPGFTGVLKNVRITGDTAVGETVISAGKGVRRDDMTQVVHFLKGREGWLIHNGRAQRK